MVREIEGTPLFLPPCVQHCPGQRAEIRFPQTGDSGPCVPKSDTSLLPPPGGCVEGGGPADDELVACKSWEGGSLGKDRVKWAAGEADRMAAMSP